VKRKAIYSGYKWKAILAYNLRLILNTGRCAEGNWAAEAVPGLVQALKCSRFSECTLAVPNIVLI